MEIDYVVPMVFPDDSKWREEWLRAFGGNEKMLASSARWRSWGTEELLIRSVIKNMPWLRKIHIILASNSQVQPWMEKLKSINSKIDYVYHYDFIPAQHLPTFNVNTIEMFLHRIPGLSECFLYGNDDMFPLSPLQPEDFFRDGLPCQHHNIESYPCTPNIFQRFCMSGLRMIASDYGISFTKTWLRGGHSIAPILRSTCESVWKRHSDRISQSFTTARSDRNFNQYIYSYDQHLSNRYVDYLPKCRCVCINRTSPDNVRRILTSTDPGIVCVNDNGKGDWKSFATLIKECVRE